MQVILLIFVVRSTQLGYLRGILICFEVVFGLEVNMLEGNSGIIRVGKVAGIDLFLHLRSVLSFHLT